MKIAGFKRGKCTVCDKPMMQDKMFYCEDEPGALDKLKMERDMWLAMPLWHKECLPP